MTVPATENAVRGAAHSAWSGRRPRSERLLVLRAVPRWTGPERLDLGGTSVRVVAAASTLAVRAALVGGDPDDKVVVLTDLDDEQLGVGLLAHAVGQRSRVVDVWGTVRQLFHVSRRGVLDSNLVRDGDRIAQLLVEREPRDGWTPAPSGVLTRDHAYRCLVERLLGLDARDVDVPGVLSWSRKPAGVLALRDLDEPVARRLVAWVGEHAGIAVLPVLELARTGHGTDAVALGIAAAHLYGRPGTERSQGAFEQQYFQRVQRGHLRAWTDASRNWVERALVTDRDDARQVLHRAEQVLRDLQGQEAVTGSLLLPGGLTARLSRFGALLVRAAAESGPGPRRELESALVQLEGHALAPSDPAVTESALMALRLVRWLATGTPIPLTTYEALRWQGRTGGWVDRARQVVWNGAAEPSLAAGLTAVFDRATALRQDVDRAAAALLADDVAADRSPGQVLPVEEVLVREVLPLTATGPVLLLVLDGMSVAVASELAESVSATGWVEADREGERAVVLAGLPTVTEVSRTSLLTGTRCRGGQSDEDQGIRAIAGARTPLFHLGDLRGGAGSLLPADVRTAVLDGELPLVAAVLNAVDDSLSGGDPGRTRWTVDAVRHLRPLLEQAALAGRTVVLVSDHGHVVDRADGGRLESHLGGGARWRPADSAAGDSEVLLAGARVQLGGRRVVSAVDESLRYRSRHEGYHGGASLAELTIPFLVFSRHGAPAPVGWQQAGDHRPSWWTSATSTDVAEPEPGPGSATLF